MFCNASVYDFPGITLGIRRAAYERFVDDFDQLPKIDDAGIFIWADDGSRAYIEGAAFHRKQAD